MTPAQVEALRPRLNTFLSEFGPHFKAHATRLHFRTYVEGQIGPLERKSVEPIADAAGVGADERYGEVPDFLETLEGWNLRYVLEVPSLLSGWTKKPEEEEGRVAAEAPPPRPLAEIVQHARALREAAWVPYHVKDTRKGPEVWEAKEIHFWQHRQGTGKGRVSPRLRLVVARNVLDGTQKTFLSNAPGEIPIETLLRVAFSRWHVERCFEDSKGEVGMDHFEVRRYGSVRRHLVVSMVSHLFLAEQAARLRKKKPARHGLPGQARRGHAARQCRSAPRCAPASR